MTVFVRSAVIDVAIVSRKVGAGGSDAVSAGMVLGLVGIALVVIGVYGIRCWWRSGETNPRDMESVR